MTRSDLNRSTCTTCQSTKMRLNGATTACQCPVCSPSKIFQRSGEPLAILLPVSWTTKIIFVCRWKVWICWWNLKPASFVFWPSSSMSVETSVSTAQSWLVTVRGLDLPFIWTVTMAQLKAAILVVEYLTKITLVVTIHGTPIFAAPPRWVPQLSSG